MDPERTQRLMWALAALGFAMAILGAVGELLGWWNDVGQLLMGAGTLLGVVMSSSSLLVGSSRDQVRALDEGQATTHRTLRSMDGKLDSIDAKLEPVDGKLDSMDGKLDKLDVIEEALVEDREEGRTSKLDVVQAELNAQTGALEHQVRILEDIREAV